MTSALADRQQRVWELQLGAHLADSGDLISLHDLWIAATALFYGFGVATLNTRDFSRVPGLRVLSPR